MFENLKLKIKSSRISDSSGQSLIEIIIALAIGALLIGAASMAIVVVLQSSSTSQIQQSATILGQDIMEKTRAFSLGSWDGLYGLTKGSSTLYYFYTTSTRFAILQGKEGVIANDIHDGLVGYWKFDEVSGTTAYDYSGNGNDGTLAGGVTRATSTCKIGYCLDFDGTNDYVEIDSVSSDLNSISGLTFAAWIKWYDTIDTNQAIIRHHYDVLGVEINLVRFVVNAQWSNRPRDSTQLTEGVWYFYVGTYDGLVQRLYRNGVEVDSKDYTGTTSSGGETDIGSRPTEDSDFFKGIIDDVRIYNRALDADEVKHLYNSTLFTRYFYVENVNRDTGGDIVISGGTEDPTTQKVTAVLQWDTSQGTQEFTFFEYMTRWRNRVFHQSDWSGGSGQDSVITVPNERYASSSEINVSTPGQFKIEGL